MTSLRVVVTSLQEFINGIIKKLVLDIVANLKSAPATGYGTPVKTGWARANWIPQIGSPRQTTAGSPEQVTGSAQASGVATVATSYTFQQGPVFISNNVPYVLLLNEGSSQQAPKGFVQAAIAKAVKIDLFGAQGG